MKNLLIKKLEAINELKNFTKEIMPKSLKTDYINVNTMIDKRQEYIERINLINSEIIEISKINNIIENKEVQTLKEEIRKVLRDISELDNMLRKNINNELDNVKKSLNQPVTTAGLINRKA